MKHLLATLLLFSSLNAQNTALEMRGKILASDGKPMVLSPLGGYSTSPKEGHEKQGKKGLQRYYDATLSQGNDVQTSIDRMLQTKSETILDTMKLELNATEVLAMVMDSKTGEMLAMATSNRYDPMHITQADIPNLNPKFTEYAFEPGFVMMPFTVAMNLNAHLGVRHKEKEWFNTDFEKFKIGDNLWIKDDSEQKALTMTDVLVYSSNIGAVQIAWQLSGSAFHDALSRYGFGHKSGIDLARDLKGMIKSEVLLKDKKHRANNAYGYGMMVTPIQLLKAYSMFSNDGFMVTPHIAIAEEYESKEVLTKPTAHKVKQMLIEVVKRGTGKHAQTEGLTIGGKTGTAHIAKNGKYTQHYNSSFYGFAEDSKGKRYTIGVLVIDAKGKNRYFASNSAVPTFKKIVDAMVKFELLTPVVKDEDMSIASKREKQMHRMHQRLDIMKNTTNVVRYKGEKTISPLIDAKVLKPFGKYRDLTYDIEVFNESVTFKTASQKANVYCVAEGKVVFAGKSKVLGKVVVMAHKNNLHTVYAGLSKIAPSVKVGKKLGSAYVLGSAKEKLIFQVTQNANFVDPMEVIGKQKNVGDKSER